MVTEIKERVCKQCGGEKPETFFRESKRYFRHTGVPKLYRVKVCNDCEVGLEGMSKLQLKLQTVLESISEIREYSEGGRRWSTHKLGA